jgi:hypothetical protein
MEKNLWLLPTDKSSRLVKIKGNLFYTTTKNIPSAIYQNIYITSDEEIKEGDWCIDIEDSEVFKVKEQGHSGLLRSATDSFVEDSCKKIILTTDQDLIKDGVQAIDDDFLEWFIKNPSCEEVEIIKIEDELISPKNPKIRFNALQGPPSFIPAYSLSNMILTYKYKIIVPNQYTEKVLLQSSIDGEVIWGEKQETSKYLDNHIIQTTYDLENLKQLFKNK